MQVNNPKDKPEERGIVPRACEAIFKRLAENKDPNYKQTVSMGREKQREDTERRHREETQREKGRRNQKRN